MSRGLEGRTPDADWLRPEWRAGGVGALMTTRAGGVSTAPFGSFNLGGRAGDSADAVASNRARLVASIGANPVWLNQVHGARVVRLEQADALPGAPVHDADASVTTVAGLACAVLVADCLPVLLAAPDGRAVGAAHAGWRGLAGGVLEATVGAVCEAAACEPGALHAWLGAGIGPTRFEVGVDVLDAFDAAGDPVVRSHFTATTHGKWLADLSALARGRLRAAGVTSIHGGAWCTASQPSRFYSFRRDGVTGRMAALVWSLSGGD